MDHQLSLPSPGASASLLSLGDLCPGWLRLPQPYLEVSTHAFWAFWALVISCISSGGLAHLSPS